MVSLSNHERTALRQAQGERETYSSFQKCLSTIHPEPIAGEFNFSLPFSAKSCHSGLLQTDQSLIAGLSICLLALDFGDFGMTVIV